MNILVTGGAGYIGSITARLLCERGHNCVVLDTLENGHLTSVDPRAELVVGSVGDHVLVESLLREHRIDAVMHLAGYIEVAESKEFPEKYYANNVEAPRRMLEAMRVVGTPALVFSSTAAVYGEPARVPILESDPKQPINPYGASKLVFEEALDTAGAQWGLRSIRLRYFNVAGAWPDGSLGEAHVPETHIIARILEALLDAEETGATPQFSLFGTDYPTPDGTCVRDYIHVCDLARAHALALEALSRGEDGGVYNLANGQGYSNREVVAAAEKVTGHALQVTEEPRRPGDPAVLIADATRARERFGWRPQYPALTDMVAHAWAWYHS
ncbi:MAG: UDP-glucose 4-epimerase GalE [Coriobacteriia bacterium]|nr:UDP-glucose 4-epimerase GalE [Coriobacteriia bacterium]